MEKTSVLGSQSPWCSGIKICASSLTHSYKTQAVLRLIVYHHGYRIAVSSSDLLHCRRPSNLEKLAEICCRIKSLVTKSQVAKRDRLLAGQNHRCRYHFSESPWEFWKALQLKPCCTLFVDGNDLRLMLIPRSTAQQGKGSILQVPTCGGYDCVRRRAC